MDINAKELVEARKVVQREEEKLMMLVKNYFEKNRQLRVENTEVVPCPENEDRQQFCSYIKIDELDIGIRFFKAEEWDSWTYTIFCKQLGAINLAPKQERRTAIQGTLTVTFIKELQDGEVTRSQEIQMYEYYD